KNPCRGAAMRTAQKSMSWAGGRLWRSVSRPGYARREAAIRLHRLLLGRDPETGLMRPDSPPLDVEWQVTRDTAEALLRRGAATWTGLGQKRPYWSVLVGNQ